MSVFFMKEYFGLFVMVVRLFFATIICTDDDIVFMYGVLYVMSVDEMNELSEELFLFMLNEYCGIVLLLVWIVLWKLFFVIYITVSFSDGLRVGEIEDVVGVVVIFKMMLLLCGCDVGKF